MYDIYLASSWRNELHDEVLHTLEAAGFTVYNYRKHISFQWSEIDPDWQGWSNIDFIKELNNPLAQKGFDDDMKGLEESRIVVLIQPSGRSAHLELGLAAGLGKYTFVLLDGKTEPELMYKMTTGVLASLGVLLNILRHLMPSCPEGYKT